MPRFGLALLVLTAIGLLSGKGAQAASPSPGVPVPGTPFEKHRVQDRLGRSVTYYVSHPNRPAPLMLMIQGSGCTPVFGSSHGQPYSTVYQLVPYAVEGKFTVLVVDKPFAGEKPGAEQGTAKGCSAEFNRDFTAERWLVALQASLADARRLPWVDRTRTLAFGGSEGAVMASILAGHDDKVTDVIAIGGPGTTQLFDFIVFAYQAGSDPSQAGSDLSQRLSELESQVRAINAAPDSATDFAWGHPYKRWSSFFRTDPADDLLRSRARVYWAFGTADRSTPPLSAEVAVAKLWAAGRDVTVRRVPNADHGLRSEGATDLKETAQEYRRALDWFWAGPQPRQIRVDAAAR